MSQRTYCREKSYGLRTFPFAGKEVLFKADVITHIENKADKKRKHRQSKNSAGPLAFLRMSKARH